MVKSAGLQQPWVTPPPPASSWAQTASLLMECSWLHSTPDIWWPWCLQHPSTWASQSHLHSTATQDLFAGNSTLPHTDLASVGFWNLGVSLYCPESLAFWAHAKPVPDEQVLSSSVASGVEGLQPLSLSVDPHHRRKMSSQKSAHGL